MDPTSVIYLKTSTPYTYKMGPISVQRVDSAAEDEWSVDEDLSDSGGETW